MLYHIHCKETINLWHKHLCLYKNPSFYQPVPVLPTLALLFEHVISLLFYKVNMAAGFFERHWAQDCRTAIALFATRPLQSSGIMSGVPSIVSLSLDIKGAFDRIWWNGLLVVLVTVVKLLLYFDLICPTDICM